MLHSQFRAFAIHLQSISEGILREKLSSLPEDLEALKKCPIILASALERPRTETAFSTGMHCHQLEHGTVGIVVSF